MLRWTRRRDDDERGAAALLTGIVGSLVLVIVAAFAIDIGSQRLARRDMQALADVVALDMARLLDGKTGASTLVASSAWTSARAQSVARNGTTFGNTPSVTAVVGKVDATTGVFTQVSGAAIPDSVKVTASTEVPFGLGPRESGGATRSAVAMAASTACFRIGSYAAGLNSQDSALLSGLLNGILGLNVSALSYSGLANADIGLADLATELGVGTVDDLATANVTLQQFYLAAAQVLRNNGDTANANLLQDTIGAHVPGGLNVPVGDVVDVTTGDGAAAVAVINALDLVSAAAYVANGTNAVSIPALGTNLGLTGTGLSTSIKIIEKARQACGKIGISRDTSQGDVTINGVLLNTPTPASLTGLTINPGTTSIAVSLAGATGTMTNIVCGEGTVASPEGVDVSVASRLGSISLSQTLGISGTIGSSSGLLGSLLGGLGLGDIASVQITGQLRLTTTTANPASTRTAQIRVPVSPVDFDHGVSTGTGNLGLDTSHVTAQWVSGPTVVARTILGIQVSLSAQQLANILNSVVTGLTNGILGSLLPVVNTNLIVPLQKLLGLELAGATVFGVAPGPSCLTPELVG